MIFEDSLMVSLILNGNIFYFIGIDKEDPLWVLFSEIRYFKTKSGDKIAEPFLTLPSKRGNKIATYNFFIK